MNNRRIDAVISVLSDLLGSVITPVMLCLAAAVLRELGCVIIADSAPILLAGLSMEVMIESDPEYIFVSTMGNEDAAIKNVNNIIKAEAWQSLTAIKENRLYFLPKELFQFKPNHLWGEAYTYLSEILYDNKN